MFNPASCNVVTSSARYRPSFVGVACTASGELTLCLPLGFDDFPTDPSSVNDQFFALYKTLRAFSDEMRRFGTEQHDGVYETPEGGFNYINKHGESVTLFSKIPMLEAVLDGYDELKIFQIAYRPRTSERIDYSQIHRYLHKAVYLEDNVAYVDEMVLPQPVLSYDVTDLVRMYCFVYSQVKQALGESGSLSKQVQAQGNIFKEQYLHGDSGLFGDSHERTIRLLKERLEEIHRQVSYKNNDYWHFFTAVERFLYGEMEPDQEGMLWGISSFTDVWESMCLTYVFEHNPADVILYADSARYGNQVVGGHYIHVSPSFDSPFYLEFQGTTRFLRPDFVRRTKRGYSNPDEWFEECFDVEWTSNHSVRVTLRRQDDPRAGYFFNALSRELRVGGSRPKRGRSRLFKMVPRRRFDRAKAEKLTNVPLNGGSTQEVWDFKYVPRTLYTRSRLPQKARRDVQKQLVYEYALQLNYPDFETESYLSIPRYFNKPIDNIGEDVPEGEVHRELRRQKVKVFEADYKQVEQVYLAKLYDRS